MTKEGKKSWLKITLWTIGIGFISILAALIIIPIFYKQEIKEMALKEINKMLLADVSIEDFDLTIVSTFPKLTAQFDQVKVTGRDRFDKVELANIERFDVQIDFWSLFDDQYEVKGFTLQKPKIDVRVLQDGTANYDIVKPDSLKTEEELKESTPFKLSLKNYAIKEGDIRYDDKAGQLFAEIKNINHKGSGDLMSDIIDFDTKTQMDALTFKMGGMTYLSKVKVDLIANLLMEFKENSSKFTLRKNKLSLNSFTTSIDGFYELLADKSEMNLSLNTDKVTFKDLLSLIPTFYRTGYEKMVTNGSLKLDANLKGTLDDNNYPAWNIGLKVADASVKYPDLPEQIKNIQIDAQSNFAGGSDLNKMTAEVKKLHLEFAKNLIDANAKVRNIMTQPNIDGKIDANVDLATLGKVIPLEKDEEYKGKLKLAAKINGILSETIYPAWDVAVNLKDGVVKYPGVPEKLENIQLVAASSFSGGKDLDKMTLDVTQLQVDFLKNKIDAFLKVRQPITSQNIDAKIKANVDLATLEKVMPMEEGENYKGRLDADIILKGSVQEVQKGRYNNFNADGTLTLKNVVYATPNLPKEVNIKAMLFKFTPKNLNLAGLKGSIGKSDFSISGTIDNYLAYWFNSDQLKGNFNFKSDLLDVDELMGYVPASESNEEAEPSTTIEDPILIPKNIDFNLNTQIKKVKYSGIDMNNVSGNVGLRNQTAYLNNLTTQTMGGTVILGGNYKTTNPAKPEVNINYDLKNIDINALATNFYSIGKFAPVLKLVQGKVSSKLNLTSLVKPDFSPILMSVQSLGDLSTTSVTIDKLPVVGSIGNALKMEKLTSIKTLKDITAKFKIEDGKLHLVKPMNFKMGKIQTELTGFTGLDQSIGYLMKMDIPKGEIPGVIIENVEKGLAKVNGLAPQLNLGSLPDFIPVNVNIGGTVKKPKITTDIEQSVKKAAGNVKNQVKEAVEDKINETKEEVKETVTNKVNETKEEVKTKVNAEVEKQKQKLLNEAQKQADAVKKQGKDLANKTRNEANKAAQKLIDEAGSNILKKKAAELAAKKLRDEGESKAQKIENEANKQADDIMKKAKEKADKIK